MDGSACAVRVLLLGPPKILTASSSVPVAGPLQVAQLSLLSVHPGRVLATAELIGRLWPSGAPPSAATALRVHVTRLRSTLSDPRCLPFTGRGYTLDRDLVDTDAEVFETLTTGLAGATADDRLARCDEALALWRGRPFEALDDDELSSAAQRLEQLRLAAQDSRGQALLDLDRHVQATPDLMALVRAEPLREQRTAALMLAHYRSGRQADALAAYRELRDRLDDELGVGPGEETRRLELRILRQDPALGVAPSALPSKPDARPPRTVRGLSVPPEALTAIAEVRLEQLDNDARTLAQLVAVIADPVPLDKLSGALTLPRSVLDRLVAEVSRAGLVDRSVADQVAYRRPELGDAVVAALPAALLRQLHGTAARVLAWDTDDGADLVRAAWHLVASGSVGQGRRWFLLHRALELSARLGSDDVVETLATAALDAGPDAGQTIDLRIALARSLAAQGRPTEASRVWQLALADARATGDPTRFALAVLGRNWMRRSVDGSAELCALLGEALDDLGPRRSAVRVAVQGALMLEAVLIGRPGVLLANDLEGLEADAAAIGDPESLATALNARHVLLRGTAELTARRQWASRLSQAVSAIADPWWRARAVVARIFDAYVAADFDEVEGLCAVLKREAQDATSHRMLWHHHLTLASVYRDRGNLAECDHWAEEAVLHGAARGIGDAQQAMTLHRLLMAFHTGGVARFGPAIDAFLTAHPDELIARGLSALAHAHAGDDERAAAVTRGALAQLDAAAADEAVGMTLGLLAEATTSEPELAGEVRLRLEPYTGQFLVFGQVSGTFGPADRCLAVAARTMGDHAASLRWLDAAQAQCEAAGAGPWAAECAALRRPVAPA